MPPKPNSQVTEPLAGYAQVGKHAPKAMMMPSSESQAAFLREALDDMAELDEYADELDLPPPSPIAKESALAFLEKVVREVPRSYTVSPWDGGEVIVSTGGDGVGVGIYFNAQGGASCHIVYPNRPKRMRDAIRHYAKASRVANKWVFDALRKLAT